MAQIPSFKENQRLGAQGPTQLVSPDLARNRGETISQLGTIGMKVVGEVAAYKNEKNRVEAALVASSFKDKAELLAQDAEKRIKTNADGIVQGDGKNITALYDSSFASLVEEANDLSPSHRKLALSAIEGARVQRRASISDHEVVVYNAHMFDQVEQGKNAMGAKIANDPRMFNALLDEHIALLEKLPVGSENKLKMIKEAKDTAALSVVNHYMEKGDYNGAEEVIKGELAGYFDQKKDRPALLNKIDTDRRQFYQEKWTNEDRREKEIKERKREEQEGTLSDLFSGAGSPDIVEREQAIELANQRQEDGTITFDQLQQIKKKYTEAEDGKSGDVMVRYVHRLVDGKNLASFADDVATNPTLTAADKDRLLYRLKSMGGSTRPDKMVQQRLKKAQGFINTAFPKVPNEDPTVQASKKAAAYRLLSDKMKGGSKDPYMAAMDAIAEVEPTSLILPDGTGQKGLTDEQIVAEANSLRIQYTGLKQYDPLTPVIKDGILKRLQELKMYKSRNKVPTRGSK